MSKFTLAAIDLAHPEAAAPILLKARKLADIEDMALAVVSVIPDFGMSFVGSFFKEGSEAEAIQHANEALHELVTSILGVDGQVKHILKHGNAYEEILAAANDINADLIVMGAHRPELRDYLLGPNAARVVRHAQASVYVVRK